MSLILGTYHGQQGLQNLVLCVYVSMCGSTLQKRAILLTLPVVDPGIRKGRVAKPCALTFVVVHDLRRYIIMTATFF